MAWQTGQLGFGDSSGTGQDKEIIGMDEFSLWTTQPSLLQYEAYLEAQCQYLWMKFVVAGFPTLGLQGMHLRPLRPKQCNR